MTHHVYANDNEICAASADGTSTLAADTCFSPGVPMPGAPVLYMNVCKATDIKNGAKSVYIGGKEICLQDKSYFSTSYGDEAATKGMQKGAISGAVQGKCYFTSWSPDVVVETLAVTRHMDMVTHNHSNPANTPPVYYISRSAPPANCKKDIDEMEKRCAPDTDRRKQRKGIPANKQGGNHGAWVLDHCGPALIKPGADFEGWLDDFGDLNKVLSEATAALKSEVIAKLEREIAEFAAKKGAAFIARRGLTGWIPIVGWVITAVDVVATGVELAQKIPEMKHELESLKGIADSLEDSAKKITDTFGKYKDKIKNFDQLTADEQKRVAQEVMADVQSAYAAANPCLRARKCLLVPYKETDSQADTWAGKGCCPGQTGHHLLPDAMFRDHEQSKLAREAWRNDPTKKGEIPRDRLPKEKCWDGYSVARAPTICMEGTTNTMGSHGLFHKYSEAKIAAYQGTSSMRYEKARDLMVEEVARLYGCNASCMKEQLDAYYKDAYTCGPLSGAAVVPHSGMPNGGPNLPNGGM